MTIKRKSEKSEGAPGKNAIALPKEQEEAAPATEVEEEQNAVASCFNLSQSRFRCHWKCEMKIGREKRTCGRKGTCV